LSVDISKLHNVLRDRTRTEILELLEQRGSLSYKELQNALQISHTGKLNYHLKVLGDLLVKDEQTGRYELAEKGKIAVTLLSKFQSVTAESDTSKALTMGLMLVALIAAVVLLSYLTGYIPSLSSMGQTLYGIGWAGAGLLAVWLFGQRSPLHSLLHRE
jgi:multidrug transporter EmrE-like cation transporter